MIIRLFWWNKIKNHKAVYNYGDLISKYLVKKISKNIVISSNHRFNGLITKFIKQYYLCVGSILFAASENSSVWGSGILSKNEEVKNAKFFAVRGPETRKRLMNLGYNVPEIYGDPALLLPIYFSKKIEKKYELAIIPHFVDFDIVSKAFKVDKRIKVINLLTKDVEHTTKQILECKFVISSSLHGLVVPHAYGISALWVKFSNNLSGDNIKFYDYFKSVNIDYNEEINLDLSKESYESLLNITETYSNISLVDKTIIEQIQQDLLKVCPFK